MNKKQVPITPNTETCECGGTMWMLEAGFYVKTYKCSSCFKAIQLDVPAKGRKYHKTYPKQYWFHHPDGSVINITKAMVSPHWFEECKHESD